MSILGIEQRSIKNYFQDKESDFLIPSYQRQYAWGIEECQTLWNDIENFAFPEEDPNQFNKEVYFLGPIVTFKNENEEKEVIDGQQRLTTLMLLLRAFYERLKSSKSDKSLNIKRDIEICIWLTDELGDILQDSLKLKSEVITDNMKDEFLYILQNGKVENTFKSLYAQNYNFFKEKVNELINKYPDYFLLLISRLLNYCILLPIEAETQDSALRIFSTLNDRGKPLSDSDIFKAQLYNYYSSIGKKDEFIERWKQLEEEWNDLSQFDAKELTMDELFSRYSHYERALQGIKSTTTEGLRKFYERNSYKLLKREETFNNLVDLSAFWKDILYRNTDRFSEKVLNRLFILENAPNNMWTNILSVYYLANRDKNGLLVEKDFYNFLNKIIGFIWAQTLVKPNVNNLRGPIFNEMVNIVNHQEVDFKEYKFNPDQVDSATRNFEFSNRKGITKSFLIWWAFENENQELLPIGTPLHIEHILSKSRNKKDKSLLLTKNLEKLGNKSMLEKTINISASDYRFQDKVPYYLGTIKNKRNKKQKAGTKIMDLIELAKRNTKFDESDIVSRDSEIINKFLEYLRDNELLIS